MILPTVLKSNLIAQQVVSEGKPHPKQLAGKKRASVNGAGGLVGWESCVSEFPDCLTE